MADGQHKTKHYNRRIIIIIIQIQHSSEQAEKSMNTAGRIADNLAQIRTPDIPNTKQVYFLHKEYVPYILETSPHPF